MLYSQHSRTRKSTWLTLSRVTSLLHWSRLLSIQDTETSDCTTSRFQMMEGSDPALHDIRVRKALSLAIDRDYINATVYNSGRVPAYALCPGGIPDATPGSDFRETGGDVVGGDLSTDYAANVAKAKELLADAGYPDGEGFPVFEYAYNTNTGHQAVAEAIQQMWQTNLGIDVTLSTMEWAVFPGLQKDKRVRDRTSGMARRLYRSFNVLRPVQEHCRN